MFRWFIPLCLISILVLDGSIIIVPKDSLVMSSLVLDGSIII